MSHICIQSIPNLLPKNITERVQKTSSDLSSAVQSIANSSFECGQNFFNFDVKPQKLEGVLIAASFAGAFGAVSLLASGMPVFSMAMLALSVTTAIGSVIAKQETTLTNLRKVTVKIQNDLDDSNREVLKLKVQNEKLESAKVKLEEAFSEQSDKVEKSSTTTKDQAFEISNLKAAFERRILGTIDSLEQLLDVRKNLHNIKKVHEEISKIDFAKTPEFIEAFEKESFILSRLTKQLEDHEKMLEKLKNRDF